MSVCAEAKQSSDITENELITYRTRVTADIPQGFSEQASDHPHSGALQAGYSSPDHTL